MNYVLLDAARAFLRALKNADEATLNATYQCIANEANDSDLGQTLEARQGLCVAMQAEVARRSFVDFPTRAEAEARGEEGRRYAARCTRIRGCVRDAGHRGGCER